MGPISNCPENIALRLGRVVAVRGSCAAVGVEVSEARHRATVGTFVGIRTGGMLLIAMITALEQERLHSDALTATATLDLLGEIDTRRAIGSSFRRGITTYPVIGDAVELMTSGDLQLIFQPHSGRQGVATLHQNAGIRVSLNVDELVSKHFAVLGTTGVGKSTGVAIILNQIIATRPDVRIFVLDGHNEYGRCFGDKASVITARNLRLPFWLFNFEELIDVIFGGRPPIPEEVDILSELIPLAKGNYPQYRAGTDRLAVKRPDPSKTGLTVDTPVPYVLQDLLALIDERMGRLENRASRLHYHRLTNRIETIRNDPRYAFMFENANLGGDLMADLLAHLFRLNAPEQPVSVMQLAGLPVEVLDAVVCVLCRLAFELGLWSEGAFPLLFICEEAHRYAGADRTAGFNPTRRALSRIAKEGRKYGIFLGLVTQRPAELDPNIISQCSTLFAMRMANEDDQRLVRTAVPDAATSLLAFLPSLGTREVIGFGEGIPLPARLAFDVMPREQLPRADATHSAHVAQDSARDLLQSVVERWRGASMTRPAGADTAPAAGMLGKVGRTSISGALDQARSRTLDRA